MVWPVRTANALRPLPVCSKNAYLASRAFCSRFPEAWNLAMANSKFDVSLMGQLAHKFLIGVALNPAKPMVEMCRDYPQIEFLASHSTRASQGASLPSPPPPDTATTTVVSVIGNLSRRHSVTSSRTNACMAQLYRVLSIYSVDLPGWYAGRFCNRSEHREVQTSLPLSLVISMFQTLIVRPG